MSFGSGTLGSSPYGGKSLLFQVDSASSWSAFIVVVTFSEPPDLTDPETTNPANYFIQNLEPGTLIGFPQQVLSAPDVNSVYLVTPQQEYIQYSVTVNNLVSSESGTTVDTVLNTAEFTGQPVFEGGLVVKAVRANAVNIVLDFPMIVDAALLDPANYSVIELSGAPIPVVSVVPNTPSNATRIVLELGLPLRSSVPYNVTVGPAVHRLGGGSLYPSSGVVVWVSRALFTRVPFSSFSKELTSSNLDADPNIAALFGEPDGLVFFSPSLKTGGAPNSSIQVDDVSVCTTAFDTYRFPQPIDPKPLFTYNAFNTTSYLNGDVLFTDFYRLGEARHTLRNRPQDAIGSVTDVGAMMVLTEVWPPARVALLNNPGWALFDGVAPPPYDFVTADNMLPFPVPVPGPTHYFVNPLESISVVEGTGTVHAMVTDVVESIVRIDDFDLTPGDNAVQVNVSESIGTAESVSTLIGVNLFETVTVIEGLTVST